MAFISASFYLFLAVVVLAYYLVPLRVRWVALLAGSLWFYFWLSQYDPARLAVLVGAALVCWGLALLQRRIPGLKRLWLGLALAATALPLLALKEAPFFSPTPTAPPRTGWWHRWDFPSIPCSSSPTRWMSAGAKPNRRGTF